MRDPLQHLGRALPEGLFAGALTVLTLLLAAALMGELHAHHLQSALILGGGFHLAWTVGFVPALEDEGFLERSGWAFLGLLIFFAIWGAPLWVAALKAKGLAPFQLSAQVAASLGKGGWSYEDVLRRVAAPLIVIASGVFAQRLIRGEGKDEAAEEFLAYFLAGAFFVVIVWRLKLAVRGLPPLGCCFNCESGYPIPLWFLAACLVSAWSVPASQWLQRWIIRRFFSVTPAM